MHRQNYLHKRFSASIFRYDIFLILIRFLILNKTRMRSSRMCTARSSSRLLGGGSASVHAGIHTPGCGPGDAPWVWDWRPPSPQCRPGDPPLGVGLETPHPGMGLETPPRPDPSTSPGCGPGDPPGQTS